ncbi:hypothetical protein CRUP_009500 [Coryphaenoides rupestris]|nr:hypothetical protein CRUP_009500 [Coryphaenoides rupestris]
MSGYLSGPQVRNALLASNLTQTQLATIWTLADVDGDGQLRADEFILAMHLVDMAKSGHPLPLSLPQDLVPPSLRPAGKCSELDKLKENFARGSAELEKRRLALEEERRRERERRDREEREAQERREREAREQENRRRLEEARRLERQREVERHREEVERQREEERIWELERKEGNKHKQISDRLRDAQSKRRIQKSELDLVNQKRDVRIAEINTLQVQFEFGDMDDCILRALLSLLTCLSQLFLLIKELREKQLTQQAALDDLVRVKEQKLRELQRRREEEERERRRREEEEAERRRREEEEAESGRTSRLAKLEQERLEEQERREQERREREEEEARQRRLLEEQRAKQREEEEREAQARLRAAQEKAQEEERRRREAEKEEQERRRKEEEEEEEERRRREKEEKEEQERRRKEEEQAAEEEQRRKKEAEEEEEKQRQEEERKQKDEERRRKEQQEVAAAAGGGGGGGGGGGSQVVMSLYRALYPFTARNADELSLEANCLIEVDEATVGEPGWLCGSYRGNRGWFPQSYAERCAVSSSTSATSTTTAETTPSASSASALLSSSGLPPDGVAVDPGPSSAGPPVPHSTHHGATLWARAVTSWSAASDAQVDLSAGGGGSDVITALLSFSQGDVIGVLQQREDWWLGQLGGTQGWFPKDYVTLETSNTDVDGADASDSVQLEDYVALYTYESPEAGDLTFDEGDVVMVTEREGEWWRGCIGDRAGVFPSNYVRPVEPELSLSPGQLIVVLAKNSTGWWLGELQARGKKRQRGWFHSSNVKLLGPSSGKATPSPLPVCQVIAMYDYTAANQDELSFSKGQLISVLDKTNPDWWKGEVNGVTGLLPTNYVKMTTESDPSQQWCADLMSLDTMAPQERKRQGYIHELIHTEETYVEDLELVLEVFHKPMSESGRLSVAEMGTIFVNWRELIMCNTKLLKALRVRKKTGGENMAVQVIGDLLAAELAHMQPYIRFCSCQLNAAALLQRRTTSQPDFKDFLKRAEELCSQVNEGVREKENSDRLEWIQSHVQCDGLIEHLVFNSLTNCLGPRKLLHSGRLHKTRGGRELWVFLFSDFLLLTVNTAKSSFSSSSSLCS